MPTQPRLESRSTKDDRLCRDYLNGECKRRHSCKFVHDPVTHLAREIVGLHGWYGSSSHPYEEFIDIKFVGRFEPFGPAETRGQRWEVTLKAIGKGSELVRLDTPIVVDDLELFRALQRVQKLAERHRE